MRKLITAMAMALVLPTVVSAQGNGHGRKDHGDKREQRDERQARRGEDRRQQRDAEDRRPQSDRGHWNQPRYDRDDFEREPAWQHGRFPRGTGPRFVWQLRGGNRARFNVGGVYFSLLAADYRDADDWYWDHDRIVIYDDFDHDGWYLAYNVRLGAYLHVRYLGYN